MRTKKPFLIALFLFTWSIVSYYLLIRQTDTATDARHASIGSSEARRQREQLLRQLNRLETNIQEENVIHDQLVKKLIQIARLNDQKDGGGGGGGGGGGTAKVISLDNSQRHADNSVLGKVNVVDSNQAAENLDVPAVNDIDKIAENTELQPIDSDAPLINRLKELNKRNHDFNGPIIPVIVFACNRVSVRHCLDDLVKYRPNSYQFPIIVSQVSSETNTFLFFSLLAINNNREKLFFSTNMYRWHTTNNKRTTKIETKPLIGLRFTRQKKNNNKTTQQTMWCARQLNQCK